MTVILIEFLLYVLTNTAGMTFLEFDVSDNMQHEAPH